MNGKIEASWIPNAKNCRDSILNLQIFNLNKRSIFLEIFCNGHFINLGDNSVAKLKDWN